MKNLLAFHHSNDSLALDRAAMYYLFVKWFKEHHKAYYMLYATHITVPGKDLQIDVSMDYIAPEDKRQMKKIVDEFNLHASD